MNIMWFWKRFRSYVVDGNWVKNISVLSIYIQDKLKLDCDKKSWSLKYINQFIFVSQIQKWFHMNEQLTTCPPQIFPTMNVLSMGWQTVSWRLFIISLHDLYNKITIALRSMPLMRSCYSCGFPILEKIQDEIVQIRDLEN